MSHYLDSLSNNSNSRRNGKWLNCVIYERRSKIHHYQGIKRWACFYVFMCFLPKRRASRDHAPGPIIAAVTPSVARTIEIHGSLAWVIVTHNSITAINVPTTGVQRPKRRSIPAPPPSIVGIIENVDDVPVSSMTPSRMSKVAVRIR